MRPTHCLAPARARRPVDAPLAPSRYARMFPELPSFSADEAFLFALGRAGGLCDCQTEEDDAGSLGSEAAGWPFFGQFIAHDITADRSTIRHHVDAAALPNARTPQLNLECLYGDGPVGHPFLFRRDDAAKLLLSPDANDVQRNAEGTAVIGDPRNDSHVFMSQMHLAFARAHNGFVDAARRRGVADADVFATAARELRWHYQTAVLEEFLPSLIGSELTRQIVAGDRRYYQPEAAFIPLEFADAAYRYGHGQTRHRYLLQNGAAAVPVFPDLLGFQPVGPQHRVDWTLVFDAPGQAPAQRARKLAERLVGSLIALPTAITGACEVEELSSLAVRDLERGEGVGLPSGESIARHFGERPLSAEEVGTGAAGWNGETPLWYYILREADVRTGGHRLGPIGGRIVGEVLVGLLELDPSSVRHAPDSWKPSTTFVELLVGLDRGPMCHRWEDVSQVVSLHGLYKQDLAGGSPTNAANAPQLRTKSERVGD